MAGVAAGFVEVELWSDELWAGETPLGQTLLLVYLCLIEDVIELVGYHASKRSAVQLVDAIALIRFDGRLNGTLHLTA